MGHDVKDYGNLQQEKLDKLSIKERYLQQATKNQDEVIKLIFVPIFGRNSSHSGTIFGV